ncbi:WhiB family transcriptional regulator [Georgenia thermotolerans]|uniref:WhiB family transcriptional regulator n=1 Tax=Georgenia thermotolerans TaxID=527326 RepID=UPI0012652E15|nr:WhiB family transcriptional regulator [Georgenia thermotolerans]
MNNDDLFTDHPEVPLPPVIEFDPLPVAPDGDRTWMEDGLCATSSTPDAWYPERNYPSHKAQRLCDGCPVIDQCGEWALTVQEEWGIWGGLTEEDRRAILRTRRKRSARRAVA